MLRLINLPFYSMFSKAVNIAVVQVIFSEYVALACSVVNKLGIALGYAKL